MPKTASVPVHRDPRPEPRMFPAPSPIGGLREEIDRLFRAFEPRFWLDPPRGLLATPAEALLPAMDHTETAEAHALRIELPGMEADAVEVKLANGTLTISGEKSGETDEEAGDYHLSERCWGSFRRAVRLPEDVDRDRIEASLSNGVLTIRMPKSAAALAAERTIDVKPG